MDHATLLDLYVDELKDLWSAEQQLLVALPPMARAASSPWLRNAFLVHHRQTEQHLRRLEEICHALDVLPPGNHCLGMEGLLAEGAKIMARGLDGDVLDASLIAAAQRVEHYEMAGYGTARTWAQRLGYDDQAALLQQTLDEEAATEERLLELASQIDVGAAAVADYE